MSGREQQWEIAKTSTTVIMKTLTFRQGLWLVGAAIGMGLVGQADSLQQLWAIAPGDRTYVTTGNTERGVTINPVTGNALLLSRAGGPQVYVLSWAEGSDGTDELGYPRTLSQYDPDGYPAISGGYFTLNLVAAGGDGAVYACDLALDITSSPFKVYRWADDNTETPVTVAFEGDPTNGKGGSGQDIRFGDNFAVRGSGTDTQLAAMSRNGKYLVVFTTTDGLTFTANTLTTDASGKGGIGLTFGDGSTVWSKINGQALVQLEFNIAAGTATTIRTVPTTIVANGVTGIAYDPVTKWFAAVDYSAHSLSVLDFSDPSAPTRIGDALPMAAANANGNGTAASGLVGDKVIGLDTNNGLLAAKIEVSVVPEPPNIDTQPVATTVLEGGTAQFGVVASGTKPLSYQWRFNGQDISGQTSTTLTIPNVTPAQGGVYSVVVRNVAGEAVSADAALTVEPLVRSDALTLKWQLAPGATPWLNTDNSQRGLSYNPVNGHVLVISRTEGNKVYVLDGQTGQALHTLNIDTSVVFGGTFVVNMIGVADDGAVYICNLTTDAAASSFNIYKWADDGPDTVPQAVYIGDPGGGRWGDNFDVRGAGAETQLLAAQRNGKSFAVFTTTDGSTFEPTLLTVDDASDGNFGLGVTFGPGNTFFGKATGQSLRHVEFDFASSSGITLHNYTTQIPGTVAPIAWDNVNKFLAGVAFENPDNVRLYDFGDMDNPALIDQEFCAADNPNLNGTGQADFGSGMLFVLNSNNGISAYTVKKPTPSTPATLTDAKTAGGNFEFVVNGQAGAVYVLEISTDLKTWDEIPGIAVAGPSGKVSIGLSGGARYFRAVLK